jgi:toxin FitB
MPISGKAGFLLDTNVSSEAIRPLPDANVMAWLAAVAEDACFISSATLAEISCGVEGMAVGRKQQRLREWLLNELIPRFENRILPVDAALGLLWGATAARSKKAGHEIEAIDALIAATAERHDLTLVTPNTADFSVLKLPMIKSWTSAIP